MGEPKRKTTIPPSPSSGIRTISWRGKPRKDFLREAPLISGILRGAGKEMLAIDDNRRVIFASEGIERLAGAGHAGLESVHCYEVFGEGSFCARCHAMDALDNMDIRQESLWADGQKMDVSFIPLELSDSRIVLGIFDMGDFEDNRDTAALEFLGIHLAGIAHDLANLLGSPIAMAEYIEAFGDDCFSDTDDGRMASEYIGLITKRLIVAAKMVRTISSFSSSKRTMGEMDAEELIDTSLFLVSDIFKPHRNGGKDISLDIEKSDCHVQCRIYETDARLALVNVLQNAVMHGYDPGDSGEIKIRTYLQKGFAVIEVENDGKPITPEIADELIERRITSDKCNTGIGIYSCARRLESFGGRMEFESNRAGTTFRIILPAA